MIQLAINYGIALYELNIPEKELQEQRALLEESKELRASLSSPIVSLKEKHAVIERIFTGKFKNFLKKLCDYNSMAYLEEIMRAYDLHRNEAEGKLEGELFYVTPPSDVQLEKIKSFLQAPHPTSQGPHRGRTDLDPQLSPAQSKYQCV